MRMKVITLLAAASTTLLAACSDRPATAPSSTPAPVAAPAATATPQAPKVEIVPNNFSEGGFKNGVLVKDGASNMFYFLAPLDQPVRVKAGDVLSFAKSGDATISKIDSTPQGSFLAVFVSVDKKLDPDGDGFPNKVIVK